MLWKEVCLGIVVIIVFSTYHRIDAVFLKSDKFATKNMAFLFAAIEQTVKQPTNISSDESHAWDHSSVSRRIYDDKEADLWLFGS